MILAFAGIGVCVALVLPGTLSRNLIYVALVVMTFLVLVEYVLDAVFARIAARDLGILAALASLESEDETSEP